MTEPLRVAMIGYGFMGKAHSNAYRKVNRFFPDLRHRPVLQVLCARDADKARAFADTWGYASTETDWRRAVARDDVDLVDIGAYVAGSNPDVDRALALDEAIMRFLRQPMDELTQPDLAWRALRQIIGETRGAPAA